MYDLQRHELEKHKRSVFLLSGFPGFLLQNVFDRIKFMKQNVFNPQLSEDEGQFYNTRLCPLPLEG